MKKTGRLIALLCGLVFLTSCTLRLVDFTVISSKNVNVPRGKGQRVTAKDCVFVVIVPIGMPNIKEAIDRAIESAGADYDALVDGVIYQDNFAFIFGQMCFRVEGTPINTKVKSSKNSLNEFEGKDVWQHSSRYTDPSYTN